MVRMKALRSFTDASTGKLVMEGQTFECDGASTKRLALSGIAEPFNCESKPTRQARKRAPKRK